MPLIISILNKIFSNATLRFAGQEAVTVSLVVPSVLDINSCLRKHSDLTSSAASVTCKNMVRALKNSLQKRFAGIFRNCAMGSVPNETMHLEQPFEDDVYLISTTLDPKFSLRWLDLEVQLNGEDKTDSRIRNRIKYKVQGKVIGDMGV